MCLDCVKNAAPDRGDFCSESGCYFLNFKGCAECKSMDTPIAADNSEDVDKDNNDEETITFLHKCKRCDHVIAKHTHTFVVDGGYQEYTMVCKLCGRGASTSSILPNDPRKGSFF
eukprot:m.906432 g.906432  ORF g.906432 m.906432 type:complete len:115 (+) comp23704_c0_seq17:119-463(+)